MLFDFAFYGMAVISAVGIIAAWRAGVRDGMRMGHGEPPAKVIEPPQVPAENGEDEKLAEQLAEIEKFDGWAK